MEQKIIKRTITKKTNNNNETSNNNNKKTNNNNETSNNNKNKDSPFTPKTKEELIEAIEMWSNDPNKAFDKYGTISEWNVSKITDMSNLFAHKPDFDEDLNSWDVSNVEKMNGMFIGCTYFNQPLDNWNVSKVKTMFGMFSGCTDFNQPLNNWDVSNVKDMSDLFKDCEHFNQPLDKWDVSNVIEMGSMFENAKRFNQPLCWNVSKVKNMKNMLSGAYMKEISENEFVTNDIELIEKIFYPKQNIFGDEKRYKNVKKLIESNGVSQVCLKKNISHDIKNTIFSFM